MTEKKTPEKTSEKAPGKAPDPDSGEAQIQAAFDEANEKGYFGHSPDETPRENYTLQTPPDAPTPETERGKKG